MSPTPQPLSTTPAKPPPHTYHQSFFGHGKILLSGEYFVLDGARALAFPTRLGQTMGITYSQRFDPKLTWQAYHATGELWFKASFDLWHFNCLEPNPSREARQLQDILRIVRTQNKHFLRRDEGDVTVETRLDFPLEWGLGSSSTLICNIARWAKISPFELAFQATGGSGYDIACARANGPILYQKNPRGPKWQTVSFAPPFQDCLYFVHQGNKQKTAEGVAFYQRRARPGPQLIDSISALTDQALQAQTLGEFHHFMCQHEKVVASHLGIPPLKAQRFPDFWGEVKSLGAWGGDFALATSPRPREETRDYFLQHGLSTVLKFEDLVLPGEAPSPSSGGAGLAH